MMKILILIGLLALPAAAREPITTLAELKEIETKVKLVTQNATPATVLVFSTQTGASGSGVVVTEDGLVLTAAHVIDRSDRVNIVFPDGSEERGKVLGANFTRDAAMIQLSGDKKWPHAPLGDSSKLTTGDFVVAMGHPKGYDPTRRPPVRFGRVMTRMGSGFITTDCTLIGGDSGGPLFDLDGKVVAIHSNIAPLTSVNNHAGIEGFQKDWDRMKSGKTWGKLGPPNMRGGNRPVLGVILEESDQPGLIIREVIEGSPAASMGLAVDDILTKFENQKINNMDDFLEKVAEFAPGDTVQLTRSRNGNEKTLKITLARRAAF